MLPLDRKRSNPGVSGPGGGGDEFPEGIKGSCVFPNCAGPSPEHLDVARQHGGERHECLIGVPGSFTDGG